MAKAKTTEAAQVEEVPVDAEQSDYYADTAAVAAAAAATPARTIKVGDWLGYGNGNPDWNDPDD